MYLISKNLFKKTCHEQSCAKLKGTHQRGDVGAQGRTIVQGGSFQNMHYPDMRSLFRVKRIRL